MKMLQPWIRKLGQWRRDRIDPKSRRVLRQLSRWQRFLHRSFPDRADSQSSNGSAKKGMPLLAEHPEMGSASTRRKAQERPSIVFAIAVVSLTGVMGQSFYNQPKLAVGKLAPRTIRAPADAKVEDIKSTEEEREKARTGARPVLAIDREATEKIEQDLERSLERGSELRQLVGRFPFVASWTLSTETQLYLRQAEEWEWRSVLATANNGGTAESDLSDVLRNENPLLRIDVGVLDAKQQQAVAELRAYRQIDTPEKFAELVESVNRARKRYAEALDALSLTSNTEPANFDATLLELSDPEWLKTKAEIHRVATQMLTQGISPGLPKSIQRNAIAVQLGAKLPFPAETLATKLLLAALHPNLIQDPEKTKLQAEQAVNAVEPVMVTVRQGEVIVLQGDEITQSAFVLLDHFELSRREFNWEGLVGLGGIVTIAIGIFWLVARQRHPRLRQRDHLAILLLAVSAPLVVTFGSPYTSLPATGLLVGSFYGSAVGITVVGLLTGLLPVSLEVVWPHLLASAVGGLLGASLAGRLRSREELALLGGAVGLSEGIVYLISTLILSAAASSVWYTILGAAALHALAGLVWSIVALGLSPYLEHLFDLVTPVRLAELSNPNRPMLKRLASEAPGTFQHTLFVATLAEAAARALGCNVELVRAGTLYHDIGKMHDAVAFIENQMGGPNKHDAINDPWKSALIIKKHVSEGLVMARKCRLPKALQAFIPEHQGTMLIAYFYHQAQQRSQQYPDRPVKESDFRYPGPIPQSRETGIVMLADSCEAALRSLKDATPEAALSMVNKILRARWQDNQLVECDLTRAEMDVIANIFVQVWQQYNHQRIPYPKLTISGHPSGISSAGSTLKS